MAANNLSINGYDLEEITTVSGISGFKVRPGNNPDINEIVKKRNCDKADTYRVEGFYRESKTNKGYLECCLREEATLLGITRIIHEIVPIEKVERCFVYSFTNLELLKYAFDSVELNIKNNGTCFSTKLIARNYLPKAKRVPNRNFNSSLGNHLLLLSLKK